VRRCLVRAMYLSAYAVAVSTWGAISSARPFLPLVFRKKPMKVHCGAVSVHTALHVHSTDFHVRELLSPIAAVVPQDYVGFL